MKTNTPRRILGTAAVVVPVLLFAGYADAMDEMAHADSMAHDCAMVGDGDSMAKDGMAKDCMSKDDGMSSNDDAMMGQSMEHEDSMMQEGDSMMQQDK